MAEVLDGKIDPSPVSTRTESFISAPILGDATYTGTHRMDPNVLVPTFARNLDGLMFLHAAELTFSVSLAIVNAWLSTDILYLTEISSRPTNHTRSIDRLRAIA